MTGVHSTCGGSSRGGKSSAQSRLRRSSRLGASSRHVDESITRAFVARTTVVSHRRSEPCSTEKPQSLLAAVEEEEEEDALPLLPLAKVFSTPSTSRKSTSAARTAAANTAADTGDGDGAKKLHE